MVLSASLIIFVKTKIILNPYANRWRAERQAPEIKAACRAAGLDFDLSLTPAPGQGKQEAMTAVAQGYEAVVAAGGDGTVSEVVNGLITAAGDEPTLPLGVLPVGTGNDFNDMSNLPRDLMSAARVIAAGKTRQVDAGRVIADGAIHYFDNNCAVAMEPLVSVENKHMTRLSGNIRYVVALVKAVVKLKAWQMRISWDGGSHEGPTYLLSICNSPRTGGIFCMAPKAKMDDGLLDIVFVPEIPKRKVPMMLLRLFRGTHIDQPVVDYNRTTSLIIDSEPGTPIHADGEVIAESAKRISYEILPGRITLLAP